MSARPVKAPPIPPHPGLTVLEDEVVWAGRFPVQRVRFRFTRRDGTQSGELTWEMWRRGGGVAALPYDPKADTVALIEQFRLPALAGGMTPVCTECPAGMLEHGEEPDSAILRELREETAIEPQAMAKVGRFQLMQGGCDEVMHLYVARASLPPVGAAGTHGLANEHEDILVKVLPAEEAFRLLDENVVENATAALCIHWLRVNRDRLRREWAA